MNQELHGPQENSHTEGREGLLDDDILSQQSFSEWSYTQRFRAMRSIERLIKETSRQGKRSDLEETQVGIPGDDPSVESRHKLDRKSRRTTTRDRIADRLGIATATLSKYRSIGKLPDDVIEVLARMLDERKISFEAAYRMSGLKSCEIKMLAKYIDNSPNMKIDLDRLKILCTRSKGKGVGLIPVLPRAVLREVLVPRNPR